MKFKGCLIRKTNLLQGHIIRKKKTLLRPQIQGKIFSSCHLFTLNMWQRGLRRCVCTKQNATFLQRSWFSWFSCKWMWKCCCYTYRYRCALYTVMEMGKISLSLNWTSNEACRLLDIWMEKTFFLCYVLPQWGNLCCDSLFGGQVFRHNQIQICLFQQKKLSISCHSDESSCCTFVLHWEMNRLSMSWSLGMLLNSLSWE